MQPSDAVQGRGCGISAFRCDHKAQKQHPFGHWVAVMAPPPLIKLTDGFPIYRAKLMVQSRQFLKDLVRQRGQETLKTIQAIKTPTKSGRSQNAG